MEARFVVWVHEHANPWLDTLFVFTHLLGMAAFVATLVLGSIAWHVARREPRQALLWFLLGLSTLAVLQGVKPWVLRSRPELWPPLVAQGGYSFPSGHAIIGATFYPLIAHDVARRFPRLSGLAWTVAVVLAAFIGFGRIYLGLHWPTDVLAGWAIGAVQLALGLAWLRLGRGAPSKAS